MSGSMRFPNDILADFERIHQQLERVFPQLHSSDSIRSTSRGEFPAINIGSTADTVEIVAFAPGIDAKSVQITIDKGLLIVAGERKTDIQNDDERVHIYAQERLVSPFRRVVPLPEDADPARVNASFRDGFLRVSVGKRESSKQRRIEVKS